MKLPSHPRAVAPILGAALAVALLVAPTVGAEDPTTAQVRTRAEQILDWLVGRSGRPPEGIVAPRGSVRFALSRLGTARGALGSAQSLAVLRELRTTLDGGSATVLAVDASGADLALVRARVRAAGDGPSTELLLALRREDGPWRIREIREVAR